MKAKTFNVKENSIHAFMRENMTNPIKGDDCDMGRQNPIAPHYLMTDEILFKKDCGIAIGENILIELFDRANGCGKDLKTKYLYEAKSYDDVSIKLVLTDFAIALK